jgi:alpha-amylase
MTAPALSQFKPVVMLQGFYKEAGEAGAGASSVVTEVRARMRRGGSSELRHWADRPDADTLWTYLNSLASHGVPSPVDAAGAHSAQVDWWWDHLARQAHTLAQAGFTSIWLPPPLKGGSGTASVGYDVFDDYDLGSKNQRGSVPTRYGTREQLARCVAMLRANGLDVYVDLVENQRGGGSGPDGCVFRYVGADGRPDTGRFPKDPLNFHPNVPQDPGVFADYSFGADLAPINGLPKGYVFNGLRSAAEWQTRALDIQGYRLDDCKGISTDFMYPLLQHGALQSKFAVGEFYDGNLTLVSNWVFDPNGMRGRASAFDFPLYFMLVRMCNSPETFPMWSLDHAGLAGVAPFNAVTFVENHDFEIGPNHIVKNKLLAYAYILTSEGYPCVFYKDYSTDPGCLGLKPTIDNLIWVHNNLAWGPTQQRWKDTSVFAYERLWGPRLLVGLNSDEQSARTITVQTDFGPNAALHDYTGHGADVWTDGNGSVTLTIPRNAGGLGYICYSVAGVPGGAVSIASQTVTQEFEGAEDVDIPPASSTAPVSVGRVWVAAGSLIAASLRFSTTAWTDSTTLRLSVHDAAGADIAHRSYSRRTQQGATLTATATSEGWHTFRLECQNAPPADQRPTYTLTATYVAPTTLR